MVMIIFDLENRQLSYDSNGYAVVADRPETGEQAWELWPSKLGPLVNGFRLAPADDWEDDDIATDADAVFPTETAIPYETGNYWPRY